MKTVKDRIREQNKITYADFKDLAKEVYKDKPLFYGFVAFIGFFVLTSAGLFASIGVAAVTSFGFRVKEKVQERVEKEG